MHSWEVMRCAEESEGLRTRRFFCDCRGVALRILKLLLQWPRASCDTNALLPHLYDGIPWSSLDSRCGMHSKEVMGCVGESEGLRSTLVSCDSTSVVARNF